MFLIGARPRQTSTSSPIARNVPCGRRGVSRRSMQPQRWDAESGQIEDLAFRTAGGSYVRAAGACAVIRSALVVFRRTGERDGTQDAEAGSRPSSRRSRVPGECGSMRPKSSRCRRLVQLDPNAPSPTSVTFPERQRTARRFDLGAQRGRVVLDLGDVRELATVSRERQSGGHIVATAVPRRCDRYAASRGPQPDLHRCHQSLGESSDRRRTARGETNTPLRPPTYPRRRAAAPGPVC
jgi:hypothetical protein